MNKQFSFLLSNGTSILFLITGLISNNQPITIIATGLLTTQTILSTNQSKTDQNISNESSNTITQIPAVEVVANQIEPKTTTSTPPQSQSKPKLKPKQNFPQLNPRPQYPPTVN